MVAIHGRINETKTARKGSGQLPSEPDGRPSLERKPLMEVLYPIAPLVNYSPSHSIYRVRINKGADSRETTVSGRLGIILDANLSPIQKMALIAVSSAGVFNPADGVCESSLHRAWPLSGIECASEFVEAFLEASPQVPIYFSVNTSELNSLLIQNLPTIGGVAW